MNSRNKSNAFSDGLAIGCKPREDLPPSQWAAREVFLANSPIGAKFEPGGHCDQPLDDLADPEIYEIAVVGHTGMGKSAILECASCWIVAQSPGPTLVLGQTNKTAIEWMETRMSKAFSRCEATRGLLDSSGRHKVRKDAVIFPHMEYLVGGANLTNTQEKSMRYTLGDEAWAWDKGIIGELLKRHHDRWNRKSLIVSQGGTEEDDWHAYTSAGAGFDRAFECQTCKTKQIFKWGQVKFDSTKDANDEWDWINIRPSVRYECENPDCGESWPDTAAGRRSLTANSHYEPRENAHLPGRISRYIPAMANPRIELFSLVKEWLQAQDDLSKGDKTKQRQFIQKRLAQFWVEKPEVPTLRVDEDPYESAEYADGATKWEKEHFRFLTIDVQRAHFWARIRAWGLDGSSRGIFEGKLGAWENIRTLQDKFGIPNRCVFIDSRYMPEEVAKWRVRLRGDDGKFLWNMIMGEDAKGYAVRTPKGKQMLRTYSSIMRARSQAGTLYEFFKFSNLRAKDTLASLMAGNGAYFGIETDHSKDYGKQMTSEHKALFGKDWRWVKIKEHLDNHLWDCEVMQIVAACVFRCLGGLVDDD